MQDKDAITWFEIPATNLARAATFYETVLGRKLEREALGPYEMAVFPYQQHGGVGGCVVSGEGYNPSAQGNVVYVNAAPRIDDALARVEGAGGRIALPKTELPGGMGYFAHVIDSEGNRIGLHALQ